MTLACSTRSKSASVVASRVCSSMVAAVWTTVRTVRPSTLRSASSAATASRSVMSQAARVASVPDSASSAASSVAPGASAPRRLTNTTCAAPRAASHRARCGARVPEPPVTRVVPRGVQVRADGPGAVSARTMRRVKMPEGRTASWSSAPRAPESAAASRRAARSSRAAGRSMVPPQRCGCSNAAVQPTPTTCAWTGAVSASARLVETAPRVNAHTGASIPVSPRAWIRVTVRAVPRTREVPWTAPVRSAAARTETMPVQPPASATTPASRSPRTARSVQSSSRTRRRTCAPCASNAPTTSASSMPSAVTSSQLPVRLGVRSVPVCGCQATR
ncbi:hypothetical protein SAZ_40860 [Streptomyces noursei ZPM]|nr:hypothetical protein SAZ_40860 [Streptomyces noursei ZPM]